MSQQAQGTRIAGEPDWTPQTAHEEGTSAPEEVNEKKPKGQLYCGLPPRVFWIIVALIVLVALAAIGGGVGGALGTRSNSTSSGSSSSTATATSNGSSTSQTSSSSQTANISQTLEPSRTTAITYPTNALVVSYYNGPYSGTFDSTFSYTPVPPTATDPTMGYGFIDCPSSNATVYTATTGAKFRKHCFVDIPSDKIIKFVVRPSLDRCIEACAAWNADETSQEKCLGAVFAANMTQSYIFNAGNGRGNCIFTIGAQRLGPSGWDASSAVLLDPPSV